MKRLQVFALTVLAICSAPTAADTWCDQPNDLADAILHLDRCLGAIQRQEIKKTKRNKMARFHFSCALLIRNEWGLWHGSELAKQFEANGIFSADDMSALILDLYWKHLNNLPLDFQDSVASLRKEYLELAATIDSSGVLIDNPEDVIPLPDPTKVKDKIIELE